jgi:hypothetical protein
MELTKEQEDFIVEQVKAGAKLGQNRFPLTIGTYLELKYLKESEERHGSQGKTNDGDSNKSTGSRVGEDGSKKSDSEAGNKSM